MAMNPMQLMQLAERLRIFRSQHPKVLEFMHDVVRNARRRHGTARDG